MPRQQTPPNRSKRQRTLVQHKQATRCDYGSRRALCSVCREDHAIRRAEERYGVILSPADLHEIEERIAQKQHIAVLRRIDGGLAYYVRAFGCDFVVQWSHRRNEISTFHPPEVLTETVETGTVET